MIIEQMAGDEDEAFRWLRKLVSDGNRKMVEVGHLDTRESKTARSLAPSAARFSDHDLPAVMAANRRQREEISRLRPYCGPGFGPAGVVEAYRQDTPDQA